MRRSEFPTFIQAILIVSILALSGQTVLAQRTGRQTKPPTKTSANPAATAEQHYELGLEAIQRNNLAQAILSFRAAIKLKPEFAEAHNSLGMALGQQAQTDAAITSFR